MAPSASETPPAEPNELGGGPKDVPPADQKTYNDLFPWRRNAP